MLEFEDIPIASLGLGAQKVEMGRNSTWFSTILSDKHYPAFTKILPPRKVLIELICALLGRAIKLPIPRPALVQVIPSTLPESNIKEATFTFSSIDSGYPSYGTFTRDRELASDALLRWEYLASCAAFDIWIGIEDRIPDNLLFDGLNQFRLIDHEDSISPNLTPTTRTRGELAQIAAKGKEELELHRLRNQMLKSLPNESLVNYNALKNKIPYQYLPISEDEVDQAINFLQERRKHMGILITQELGIRQIDIEMSAQVEGSVSKNA